LGAGGADDSVDDEAGLNGVDPNRSSLNGSAFCGVVPLLCVCVRLDESLGTFGGGATVKKIIPITLMFQHSYASMQVPTYMKKYVHFTNMHLTTAFQLYKVMTTL
jgi:hypothetical protein